MKLHIAVLALIFICLITSCARDYISFSWVNDFVVTNNSSVNTRIHIFTYSFETDIPRGQTIRKQPKDPSGYYGDCGPGGPQPIDLQIRKSTKIDFFEITPSGSAFLCTKDGDSIITRDPDMSVESGHPVYKFTITDALLAGSSTN